MTLSDTVCVLKWVARHIIAGVPRPSVPLCPECKGLGHGKGCDLCGKVG